MSDEPSSLEYLQEILVDGMFRGVLWMVLAYRLVMVSLLTFLGWWGASYLPYSNVSMQPIVASGVLLVFTAVQFYAEHHRYVLMRRAGRRRHEDWRKARQCRMMATMVASIVIGTVILLFADLSSLATGDQVVQVRLGACFVSILSILGLTYFVDYRFPYDKWRTKLH